MKYLIKIDGYVYVEASNEHDAEHKVGHILEQSPFDIGTIYITGFKSDESEEGNND